MTGIPVVVNLARAQGEVDALSSARAAWTAGLSGVGFADSPRLFPDPLVETARVLATDTRVMAGPCVLSLALQHPARAASALATLAGHFPGRVFAVVGRGESSVANEGLTPPNMREYVAMLASLRARLQWSETALLLMGAASGPRTITATARELGGVLVDVGVDPPAVAAAVAHARTAQPDVLVWAFVRLTIAAGSDDAAEQSASLLGSCARRMLAAPEWYGLERGLVDGVAELAAAHDYTRHGGAGALRVPEAAFSPRLTEAAVEVRDRFILAGTVEMASRRLHELSMTGIAGLVLAGGMPGVLTNLRDLGEAARVLREPPPVGGQHP